ncbi:MAG: tRNA lysidine(34) synthetase TilS [Blautia sp.]|nr:tRNA lysidine(34) synthetase TilS [Blautia sp.]
MYERVKHTMEKHHMIEPGMLVLAGVSGGADSTAMLLVLHRYCKEIKANLCAVHVNHGIRGEEADRDQEFVEKLCKNYDIPCSVYRFDVPGLCVKWKLGEEETGRIVRKEAFSKEMDKAGPDSFVRIALAHNMEDRAETVIHNISRGTGIRGLGTMSPVSEHIIRPLLDVKREQIEAFLKECGVNHITDSSNQSLQYTRNRIRMNVLPMLQREVNHRAVEHISGLAGMASLAEDYLMQQGEKLLEQCTMDQEGIHFPDAFFAEHRICQIYAVQIGLERLSKSRKDFTAKHIEEILELATKETGKRQTLPYNLAAFRDYEGITIKNLNNKEMMESYGFEMCYFPYVNQKICEKKYTKWFDCDKMKGALEVRKRKTGDYMIVDSFGMKKKLTRIMIDDKVPRELREKLPVLALGSEVIWFPGGRINEKYKVTSETKRIIQIKYQGGNEE